jgi:nucleoside-diphosphate-sugar epimerase
MNSKSNQRIIILGAAGFIGYHLSKSIQKLSNINLILVDNFVRSARDDDFNALTLFENVQFTEKDLSIQDSYSNLFQQGDIVVNCVAFNGTNNFYKNPVDVVRHSAITAIYAAEYAAKARVSKYLYFGSAESYAGGINLGFANVPTAENVPLIIDNPRNVRWSYAASKTMGEIATVANLNQYGLDAKIFRVHNIYGPRMGFDHVVPDLVRNFIAGNFEVHGINESRAFMYIDDLVFVVTRFIFTDELDDNLIYHIGSTQETKIQDLADLILKTLEIKQAVIPVPGLEGSVLRRVPDTSLLKRRFAFRETDLKDGIRSYVDWFRNRLELTDKLE